MNGFLLTRGSQSEVQVKVLGKTMRTQSVRLKMVKECGGSAKVRKNDDSLRLASGSRM